MYISGKTTRTSTLACSADVELTMALLHRNFVPETLFLRIWVMLLAVKECLLDSKPIAPAVFAFLASASLLAERCDKGGFVV